MPSECLNYWRTHGQSKLITQGSVSYRLENIHKDYDL